MLKRFTLLTWLAVCCTFGPVWAQERTVSGKVTAEDGNPFPGVSVAVKGTTQGTITNGQGQYSIRVGANAVLVFSFLGYLPQEISVGERSTVDVQLQPDVQQLSEVVITALGIAQEKKSLSYSVQEVKGDELLQSREQNIVDALNAKVAGVQVVRQGGSAGAGSSILIRGTSSISGNNQPLFVIDGIPMNNSFRASIGTSSGVDYANRAIDLNPNDIENISVLKGPAATALYGIQGANGVILITTKKGAKGAKGFNVDVSSNFSTDRIMNYFPSQYQYAQGDNGIFNGGTTFNHYGAPISTLRYDASTPNVKDPNGTIVDMNHPNAGARVPTYRNQELFFRNGYTVDNHVAISAARDNSNFYLSIGNMSQQGIIPNNTFNRTSIKIAAESKMSDRLTVKGSVNYANSKSEKFGRGDNFSDAIQGLYRTPPSFDNRVYAYPSGIQRNFRGTVDGTTAFSPDNPFWTVNNNPYNDNVNRFISSLQTDYKITDWLTAMYRVGYDFAYDDRKQIWAPSSAGGAAIGPSGVQGGRVVEDAYVDKILNTDFILSANKRFGEKLETNLLIGHNLFSSASNSFYMSGFNLAIPGLYNIANTQEGQVFTRNRFEKQTQAVYTRASIGYDGALFLELALRNEWSSTLPAATRSFPYGSVGLGFVFTEYFNPIDNILSFGKLKGSYAVAGNDAPLYTAETFYNVGTTGTRYAGGIRFPIDGVGGVLLSSAAGNPNLKAETTLTYEIGADMRFLQNRIGLDFTYYKALSRDQIIAVPVPASSGFLTQRINSGEIENRGIELVLNGTAIQSGDFKWDVIINYTRNRNYVNSLPNDEAIVSNMFGARIQSRLIPGEPYGVFYGNAFKRNENGDLMINTSGYPQIDPTGQKYLGNPNPDFLMGIRNAFSYKNWNMSFLWDLRKGGDIVNVTGNWMGLGSGVAATTLDRNAVVIYKGVIDNPGGDNDGQVNNIPAVLNQAAFQGSGAAFAVGRELAERWVEDGSWIRLRDITLSYRLPSNVISRIGMNKASLGVYGRNILLFTNYSGIDPETNLAGPNSVVGLDAFTTPNMRSYGVTLNATF